MWKLTSGRSLVIHCINLREQSPLSTASKVVITRYLSVDLPEYINKRKHTVSVHIAYILTVRYFGSINNEYINKRKHALSVNK
jgi:hypothetical protein